MIASSVIARSVLRSGFSRRATAISRLYPVASLSLSSRNFSATYATAAASESSSSHGNSSENQGSDVPWAIASTLVFGSWLIYLTSPPSKKSHHADHSSKHEEKVEKVTEDKVPVAPAEISSEEAPSQQEEQSETPAAEASPEESEDEDTVVVDKSEAKPEAVKDNKETPA